MHQRSAKARRLLRQHGHSLGVDNAGCFDIAFGLVHCGVGGGVDDQIRAHPAHGFRQRVELQEIAVQGRSREKGMGFSLPAQGHQFSQRSEAALQLPAELSMLSEQQDLHGRLMCGRLACCESVR